MLKTLREYISWEEGGFHTDEQCFVQMVGCPGISHLKFKFSPQTLLALPL